MNTRFHLMLLLGGMAGAIALGALPLVGWRYTYARWAQVASVIASVTGIAWGALGLILYHLHVPVSRHLFDALRSMKAFSGGITAGIILAVLLARPWQRRQKPSMHEPQ